MSQRHQVLPVCIASTSLGESPPFLSTFQSGTRPGRALANDRWVGPRWQSGHEGSLSMARGER
ncbi:MAG: hypothetical protein IPQ09_18660 [Myxococcales bacterium]|nr:hypothetical protein [Myxococcales bacterium]